jgi:translation elongation factor P/translation initiation factor 5A
MSYTKERILDCLDYIKELQLAQMHVEDMDQFEQIEVDIDRIEQEIEKLKAQLLA